MFAVFVLAAAVLAAVGWWGHGRGLGEHYWAAVAAVFSCLFWM